MVSVTVCLIERSVGYKMLPMHFSFRFLKISLKKRGGEGIVSATKPAKTREPKKEFKFISSKSRLNASPTDSVLVVQ